jgi:E3 ubiquitin-protein ligase HERC2
MIKKDNTGMKFNSIRDIACGGTHSLAVAEENRTFSWGNGDNGRLGHGSKRSEAIPKEIMSLKSVQPKSIYCGDAHSACISSKNTIYTWGKGSYGRLGHGFTEDFFRPEVVEELINKYIEDAYLGAYHTFAITLDKEIFSWGGCQFGKLGVRGKNSGNLILPTLTTNLHNKKIVEMSAGPYHTLALNSEGKLYAWGNGLQGKLGIKSTISVDEPIKVHLKILFGDAVSQL